MQPKLCAARLIEFVAALRKTDWPGTKRSGLGRFVVSALAPDYGQFSFEVVEKIERLTTPEQVIDTLADGLGRFGFTSFLIGDRPDIRVAKPTYLINGWPQNWSEHYNKNHYYRDDPIAAWAEQTYLPYEWSEVTFDAERYPRSMEVLHAGRAFKRNAGFVVPTHRPDRPTGVVTMCGEKPDFEVSAKRAIHFISMYAYGKAVCLATDETPVKQAAVKLTVGEKEVLTWTAVGKSAWEISEILDISQDTVNWRLKNAYGKLNAVNKVQAVVNAIRMKQITV
jgi:LuxR family transcriptional regulator, quorum-sensing system regulator BjaR1